MFEKKFSTLYYSILFSLFFPFLIIYLEDNLSFILFSFLLLVLIFNVYDVLLDASRTGIVLLVSRFKFLYVFVNISFYFNALLSFFSFYGLNVSSLLPRFYFVGIRNLSRFNLSLTLPSFLFSVMLLSDFISSLSIFLTNPCIDNPKPLPLEYKRPVLNLSYFFLFAR